MTFLLLVTESINGKCEARGEKRGQGREDVMMEDARPRVKIEGRAEVMIGTARPGTKSKAGKERKK